MPIKAETPETAAARVLQEAGFVGQLPVDVYAAAFQRSVRIAEREDLTPDLSGMLLREDDLTNPLIVVRRQDARVRRRFTIAHELGHEILHAGRPVLIEASSAQFRLNERRTGGAIPSQWEEIQANRFAAELLMPDALVSELFDQYVVKSTNDDKLMRSLAQDFDVSESAMQYRLMNLGLMSPQFGSEALAKRHGRKPLARSYLRVPEMRDQRST